MAAGSSSVVDLCTLADAAGVDAATSAKFFRDDDGAGAGAGAGGATASSCFSWPEAGRTPPRLSQRAVQALCEKHKVPGDYIPISLDGRWVACQTPPEPDRRNNIFVYADALEAGMRVPLHGFYVEVLGHYGLAPSQLAPDAWRHMAAFVLLCQDAGVEPPSLLPAFRAFFSLVCTHAGDGDSGVGWHRFLPRSPGSRRLFSGKMPRTHDEWKSRFFLLQSPATRPWPCPVRWGKPSRASVRLPAVTAATEAVMKKLLDRAGRSGIDIMPFLSRRSLPVAPPTTPAPAPARKRRAVSGDTHLLRGLVDCIEEAAVMAKKAVAEIDEKDKELAAARAEVAELKEALRAANARHAGEVKAAVAGELQEEHAAAVARIREEHAAEVARLVAEQRKAAEHHRAEIDRLKEEHAADVAGVQRAAGEEVQDTKKKMVLRLFPNLDASLLERPRLQEMALLPLLETPNNGEGRS